jgi:hypothetical protein
MFTDEQFVTDVLGSASLREGEQAYLLDAGCYSPLPDSDVLAFVASLSVGCVVLVPEESDEVQFRKTALGWEPSY